jgi:hypothetical protein
MRMQLKIYILGQRLSCLLWLFLLLQRSPFVQALTKLPALISRIPFISSALLKKSLPVFVGGVGWNALSGATTFITSNDGNPVSGSPGDDFEFGFSTNEGAHFAFSYSVEDLPGTLSFNDDAFGPLITGTLPDVGTYTISVTGYRFAGLSGNSTPVYTLNLNVAGPDNTKPVITLVGDSTMTLTVGETYTEFGATAIDETDGDTTPDIVIGGDAVDPSTEGSYTITYNVSDATGNAATQVIRNVVVQAHEIFLEANDIGDAWWLVDWLGYLTNDSSHNGWSYHRELGWIYIANSSTSSDAWIYLFGSSIRGWLWTNASLINQVNGLPEGLLYLFPHDGSVDGWHYLQIDSDTKSSTFGSAFLYDFVSGFWNLP